MNKRGIGGPSAERLPLHAIKYQLKQSVSAGRWLG